MIDSDDDEDYLPEITEEDIEEEIHTIYFAHSYKLWKTEEEKDWLDKLQERFPNHEIVNPFDTEEEITKACGGMEYYAKYKLYGYNANLIEHADIIRVSDLAKVEKCNGLVAYIGNERQIGTITEIHHAWIHDKRIYVICDQPSPFFVGNRDIFWYPNKGEFFGKW